MSKNSSLPLGKFNHRHKINLTLLEQIINLPAVSTFVSLKWWSDFLIKFSLLVKKNNLNLLSECINQTFFITLFLNQQQEVSFILLHRHIISSAYSSWAFPEVQCLAFVSLQKCCSCDRLSPSLLEQACLCLYVIHSSLFLHSLSSSHDLFLFLLLSPFLNLHCDLVTGSTVLFPI